MSKIKAVDFAKYVNDAKNYQKDILINKGVEVENNKSLLYYVEKTNELPNKDPDAEYIMDSYFAQMEEEYDKDPLLTKNGGEYEGCNYYIINTRYDTTYFPAIGSSSTYLIKTSDGQEFTNSNTAFTIQWDISKDTDALDDGTPVRWIKIYATTIQYNKKVGGCYPSNSTSNPPSLLYLIYGFSKNLNATSSRVVESYAQNQLLRGVILSDNVNSSTYTIVYNCYSLEYLGIRNNSFATPGIVDSGFSLKKLDYNSIDLTTGTSPVLLSDAYVLEKADFGNVDASKVNFNYSSGSLADYSHSLKHLIMPDVYNEVSIPECFSLEFLDLKKCLSDITISGTYNLKNVIISKDWDVGLKLSSAYKLTKDSILSIFNNVKDLTDSDTKTLTFSKYLAYDLTEEELAIATNKNWTVTFA